MLHQALHEQNKSMCLVWFIYITLSHTCTASTYNQTVQTQDATGGSSQNAISATINTTGPKCNWFQTYYN